MNNHNAMFEYKGMKTARVTDRRMDRVDTLLDLHFANLSDVYKKKIIGSNTLWLQQWGPSEVLHGIDIPCQFKKTYFLFLNRAKIKHTLNLRVMSIVHCISSCAVLSACQKLQYF